MTILFNLNRFKAKKINSIPWQQISYMHKRFMMSRSFHVARAGLNILRTLTNPQIINENKEKPEILTTAMVDLSLAHQQGTVQHKVAFLSHMLSHKFTGKSFYQYLIERYGLDKIHFEPHQEVTIKTLNEISILYEYYKRFENNIEWIHANLDAGPATFPKQIQSNQDFWVMVKTKDKDLPYKCIPQDEKSGMNMFKHSTRGSIGLLTYDQEGRNILIMSKEINTSVLKEHNKQRISMLQEAMDQDKNEGIFENVIKTCNDIYKSMLDDKTIFEGHEKLNMYLWSNLQRSRYYTRSVSFIFTKHINYPDLEEHEQAFAIKFISQLGNKIYNLDKRQDQRDVCKALLVAYKKEIDKDIVEKLYHLHYKGGITLNAAFLQDLKDFIKNGIL